MDREDWIYLGAVSLVAIGAGLFHPGAGLICAGIGVGFPFVQSMARGSRPKTKDES
jgi:hypothetical protein